MALILFFPLKYGVMFDDKYSYVIGWIIRTYLPLHFMLLHINVHIMGEFLSIESSPLILLL